MKVLLWSPLGAGEHYYGPGAFAHRLYSLAPPGAVDLELVHSSPRQGSSTLFSSCHRLDPQPDNAVDLARFLWRARRWLKANAGRFDVLHGLNGFHPTVHPAFAAQQLGLPTVIFVAGHNIEFTDKPGLRALAGLAQRRRRMVRQLSAVVAMSRAICDELLQIGVDQRRIARIPMGVDMRRFRPAESGAAKAELQLSFGLAADLPTLVFVGAVTPRKCPHLIVEALGALRQRGIDCQLLIAGPTPLAAYAGDIRRRSAELGVAHLVHWLGHVAAVENVLRAADVFVLPSTSEGMPAALVEAMACGLPSVVTRISGCEDLVVADENGFFVRTDAAELAEIIGRYALDSRLCTQHGARARDRIAQACSSETVLRAYLDLFAAVRQGRDPATASTLVF
jgi:glycosyltransferase involved in cell wall biosynthesis